MHEILYGLVIVAAVLLMIVRQSRPRRIRTDLRGMVVLPAVMVIIGFSQGGLLDADHSGVSAALLAAEIAVGLLMGVGWAATSRIWIAQDGTAWSRGSKATALIWVAGLLVRVGLMGVGALLGVHESTGPLLIALGVSFAVRGVLLVRRAAGLPTGPGASYRDDVPMPSRRDRV
jgi:hypothetical protein